MGEGKDKASRSLTEMQPTSVIELWSIIYDYTNNPNVDFKFHAGSNGVEGPIVFNGVAYQPLAVEGDGFEVAGNQKLPRPKMRISNEHLFITDLLLSFNDLKDARVKRTKTLLKFLDGANFDGGVNPFGASAPNAIISEETFIVAQKISENRDFVEIELASPLDLENASVPKRDVNGRYCFWQYRGHGCGYKGPLVEKENGEQFTCAPTGSAARGTGFAQANPWDTGVWVTGDICYIENPKITVETLQNFTSNTGNYGVVDAVQPTGGVFIVKVPMRVYYACVSGHSTDSRISGFPPTSPDLWEKDGCGKTIGACKKHFLSGDISYTGGFVLENTEQREAIPFGGFPATDNFSS